VIAFHRARRMDRWNVLPRHSSPCDAKRLWTKEDFLLSFSVDRR
jgi:hypothetical protein